MTDADGRSDDDSLPPAWLIITGIIAVLTLILIAGFGVGQQWGANEWGPLAAWLAGGATFAAVVVALRQSHQAKREAMRGHLARLVDHEVSRRRECIKALGDLWAAIVGREMDFTAWTNYLDGLPETFNPNEQNLPGPLVGPVQTYASEYRENTREFSWEWQNRIEPPLFVVLLVLRGTDLYKPVSEVNDIFNEIKRGGLDAIRDAVTVRGQRPNTQPIIELWNDVVGRRDEHLRLARQHFSLARPDVEKDVRRNSTL